MTRWTSMSSALSRNSRLLLQRDQAHCTTAARVRLHRRIHHQTTTSRRRPSPRHQCHQYHRDPRTRCLQLRRSALGSGRRRCFVERRPRVAPPRAGCCACDVFNNGASSSDAPSQSSQRSHLIVLRVVLVRVGVGRRPGEWSLASLGLTNEHSNGVSHGMRLPGGSSLE